MAPQQREYSKRKQDYRAKLERNLDEYKNILVIHVDNVGSKQLQEGRIAMRGRAEFLFGKNTIIRKVLRDRIENGDAKWSSLLEVVEGNIGFVFTNENPKTIRTEITANKVPAAARVGLTAPDDVIIPAGPTGLDPGQTSFFQAVNIATKIIKGSIEIMNPVQLCREGEKVTASAVALLSKLNIKPFFFGIKVWYVVENANVYDAKVLDMSDDDLLKKFMSGVRKVTQLALACGYPTASTVPHSFGRALKKIISIAVATEGVSFPIADKYNEYLKDPAGYAAKHGLTLGGGGGQGATEEKKGGGGGGGGGAAAKAPEPEPEPEETEEAQFDLFD